MVRKAQLSEALTELGLSGKRVCFHCALSSFGCMDGGAQAVVEAICEIAWTCVMPAFSFRSVVAPPPDDRPTRNGIDYETFRTLVIPTPPFRVEEAPVDKKVGSVARTFAAWRGTVRSDHPWLSYAAWGEGARELVDPHPWESGSLPLERLVAGESYLALLGVTLSSCSALHLSCERAGRRNFIRWALDREGRVRRLRVGGCSKGFDRLLPATRHLFREARVGEARILVANLPELVSLSAQLMLAEPELTRCSPECLRCRDAVLGGPLE